MDARANKAEIQEQESPFGWRDLHHDLAAWLALLRKVICDWAIAASCLGHATLGGLNRGMVTEVERMMGVDVFGGVSR